MKFHHIGLFVPNIEAGIEHLGNVIRFVSISDPIKDPLIDVTIVFVTDPDGITYEMVAPLSDESPVNGVLQRGSGFLNHIAYTSNQYESDILRLRKNGNVPLGPSRPAVAFNGKKVMFFLNKLNFIIEIIEV